VFNTPAHVSFIRNADGESFHSAASVRLDAGVRQHDAISPFYDSMIAKLIVWGETREAALKKMDAALAQTHIVGLHTNTAFLRRVVNSKSFANADLDTALIEREKAVLFHQQPLSDTWLAAAAACHVLHHESQLQTHDPFSARDAWRMNSHCERPLNFALQNGDLQTQKNSVSNDILLTVTYFSRTYYVRKDTDNVVSMQFSVHDKSTFDISLNGERKRLQVYEHLMQQHRQYHVFGTEGSGIITLNDALAHAGEEQTHAGGLTAPMPGKVIALLAKKGDAVKKGQPLAVMEAMKMEHTIAAPRDGVVQELLYRVGDQVTEGAALIALSA
jgi:3-methylcrotonyl-CoA carboxylase alpha subunit